MGSGPSVGKSGPRRLGGISGSRRTDEIQFYKYKQKMNYRLQETAVGGRRGVKFIIPGLMSPTNDLLVYPFRLGLV